MVAIFVQAYKREHVALGTRISPTLVWMIPTILWGSPTFSMVHMLGNGTLAINRFTSICYPVKHKSVYAQNYFLFRYLSFLKDFQMWTREITIFVLFLQWVATPIVFSYNFFMDYRTNTTDDGSLAFVGIDARTEIVDLKKIILIVKYFYPFLLKKVPKSLTQKVFNFTHFS